ncbi:PspC domain-containing protein [Citricoccus sp. GCM10030269]|uniref:PspC domain-containing protein n=1 Tax=Citricoccus sp. GCM10030269 TaxID=3273388 RepID=UPI00360612DC
MNGFYSWIYSLRTVRAPQRWLGGVVAGLGARVGMDRTLARALFVVLTFLTGGFTVLFYGLAWMFLPEPDGRIHAREAGQGRWTSGMTGALIFSVLGFVDLFTLPGEIGRGDGWWDVGNIFGLAIIAVFVWLVISQNQNNQNGARTAPQEIAPAEPTAPTAPTQPVHLAPSDTGWYSASASTDSTPDSPPHSPPEGSETMTATSAPPTAPPPPPAGPPAAEPPAPVDRTPPSLSGATQLAVVGLALLGAAAISLLRYLEVFMAPWPVVFAASMAAGLAVLAVGVAAGALAGRGGGSLTVISAILIIPVLLATSADLFRSERWDSDRDGDWDGGTLTGNPNQGYSLSFGEDTIDLSGLQGDPSAQAEAIPIDVSFSNVDLVVPDDVDVFLRVDDTFSTINYAALDADNSGSSAGSDDRVQIVNAPGDDQILIDADVTFSELTVRVEDTSPAATS